MTKKLKVPESRRAEAGVFIGGAWVPFANGIVEVPDGCDYSLALPGFTAIADSDADAPLPVIDTGIAGED